MSEQLRNKARQAEEAGESSNPSPSLHSQCPCRSLTHGVGIVLIGRVVLLPIREGEFPVFKVGAAGGLAPCGLLEHLGQGGGCHGQAVQVPHARQAVKGREL